MSRPMRSAAPATQMLMRLAFVLVLSVPSISAAKAAPATTAVPGKTTAATAPGVPPQPLEKPFSVSGNVGVSTNLRKFDEADKDTESSLWIIPAYKFTELYSTNVRVIIKKNLENDRETSLENTRVTLARKAITLNPVLELGPMVSGVLPTSETSRKKDSFKGALQIRPILNADLSPLGLKNLGAYYQISFSRNFHTYTTDRTGESNAQYSLAHLFGLSYGITEKLKINFDGDTIARWSYNGDITNAFDASEELEYQINPTFSAVAGHSNSGNAFKENGTDSNLSLYNGASSTVYAKLGFSF